MEEKITIDTILSYLREAVEEKRPLGADVWVDAAMKINLLISDEHDFLLDLQQQVAQLKIKFIEEKDISVARADLMVETTEEHKVMRKQKARIEMIEEFIRIAKLQARLKSEEFRNQS